MINDEDDEDEFIRLQIIQKWFNKQCNTGDLLETPGGNIEDHLQYNIILIMRL